MRRAGRAFLILLAVLGLTLAMAPQANALTYAGAVCAHESGIGYNVHICALYGWRMQSDGTGVHVENVELWAAQGSCGDFNEDPFSGVTATSLDTGDQRVIGTQGACDTTWNLELNGKDVGAGKFVVHGNANIANASDFNFDLVCTIKPNDPDVCYSQTYG